MKEIIRKRIIETATKESIICEMRYVKNVKMNKKEQNTINTYIFYDYIFIY